MTEGRQGKGGEGREGTSHFCQQNAAAAYELVLQRQRYLKKTSYSHAEVRRSISTKFCTMIEVVCAIISPLIVLCHINSLAAIGHRKFG